jgi:hypothetical protein
MPLTHPRRNRFTRRTGPQPSFALIRALLVSGVLAVAAPALAGADAPQQVRSREVELHYRADGVPPDSLIELWYTRDRGASWKRFGADDDRTSPLVFTAPAEGLYGLKLIIRGKTAPETPPAPFAAPHRWVFIDFTPPLAQWDTVEPGDNFARARVLHLRWTAYDDNFGGRPVSLAYSNTDASKWTTIEASLPNTGRYDWTVPASLTGSITLRLAVTDLGGNIIERVRGPVSLDKWAGPSSASAPTTRPVSLAEQANAASTAAALGMRGDILPPASRPAATGVIPEEHLARELYRQGAVSLARGQQAVAAERFREALEIDPGMSPALLGLAEIYCNQKDYSKSLELYNQILLRDGKNPAALRGAALAYVGGKDYAHSRKALQQLLAGNDRDAQAWLDLGDVLFMMGQQAQARQHWSRAAGVDPAAEAVVTKARKRLEVYADPAAESAEASSRER